MATTQGAGAKLVAKITEAAEAPTVRGWLEAQRGGIEEALAGRIPVEKFLRAVATEIGQNATLQKCERISILGALFTAAQLGLEVGGPLGHAYLVPYKNQATLIIGYRGYLNLFARAGVRRVDAFVVHEGDDFGVAFDPREGRVIRWTDADPWSERGPRKAVGAVAYAILPSGQIQPAVMSQAAILRRRPSGWENTPWKQWEEEMSLKTVLRQLAKTVPTADLGLALERDGAIIRRIEGMPAPEIQHLPAADAPADEPPLAAADPAADDPINLTPEERAELEAGA